MSDNVPEDNDIPDRVQEEKEEEEKEAASTKDLFEETAVALSQSKPVEADDNLCENVEKPQETAAVEDRPAVSTDNRKSTQSPVYDKDEHGNAIYTDPKTQQKFKWCATADNWLPLASDGNAEMCETSPNGTYENEHYIWDALKNEWIPKVQATETEHYKWDAEKKEWVPKANVTYDVDEDGQRIYTDKDGAVFFWDTEKSAWFPKIDDDFMARYQMNYGFVDNTSAGDDEREKALAVEAQRKADELQRMTAEATEAMRSDADGSNASGGGAAGPTKRKAAQQEPPKWFDLDPAHNTKVYVSNLPLDITLDEFADVMGKCGMIMRDPQTQKYKLKLYTEPDGQIKGDGLCDYIKVESVDLALDILDEYDLRGHKLHVQRAKFQMRGDYNPALKLKRKKKDKEKLQKLKEKLFDWRPEKMRGERTKNEKIVIIKNLFSPEIFEKEVQLLLDYQTDLREECSKCGTVRKVVVYDRHAEGVAQINMATPEEADLVIQMMQGRFFGKRQLSAAHWDGKTKYKIDESETEVQKRISNWDEYLDGEPTTDQKPDDAVKPVAVTLEDPKPAAAELES